MPAWQIRQAFDAFNSTIFHQIKTDKLRSQMMPQPGRGAGILEWRVYSTGAAPVIAPVVEAGIDRSVMPCCADGIW